MRIRSLDTLDLELAWQHLLFRTRRFIDVPDRLPFEVLDRTSDGLPRLEREHHLRPVHLVMATKASGVFRPFVRMSPIDLLLYQALVDALAPDLEDALGRRDRVFAYRQNLDREDDPFGGTPSWTDFMASVRSALKGPVSPNPFLAFLAEPSGYALTADVSNFFVYIDIDELERRLLAATSQPAVVRDLGEFLRALQQLGVRGLPQGVPPSSPLGNFYLHDLDEELRSADVDFRRYMDDVWIFADSYAEARRLQDQVERVLYEDRLALGGDKLKIRRAATALRDTETAEEVIQLRRESILEEVLSAADNPYVGDVDIDIDEQEIDEAAVHGEYDELVDSLRRDEFPRNTRSRFVAVYRELERGRDPHALADVPEILVRLPDLTGSALRYLARARVEDANDARAAMLEVLGSARFHRDQEWLHICRAALSFTHRPSPAIAERLAEVAREHDHALVRARALLAWGSQSEDGDFDVADSFWPGAAAAWRPYVLVAIQAKDESARDERYDRWSGEERFLRVLADRIRDERFAWTRI